MKCVPPETAFKNAERNRLRLHRQRYGDIPLPAYTGTPEQQFNSGARNLVNSMISHERKKGNIRVFDDDNIQSIELTDRLFRPERAPSVDWTRRIIKLLEDHDGKMTFEELIHTAAATVPPGRAYRLVEYERQRAKIARERRGLTTLPGTHRRIQRSKEDLVSIGSRRIVYHALRSMHERGTILWQNDEDGVRWALLPERANGASPPRPPDREAAERPASAGQVQGQPPPA